MSQTHETHQTNQKTETKSNVSATKTSKRQKTDHPPVDISAVTAPAPSSPHSPVAAPKKDKSKEKSKERSDKAKKKTKSATTTTTSAEDVASDEGGHKFELSPTTRHIELVNCIVTSRPSVAKKDIDEITSVSKLRSVYKTVSNIAELKAGPRRSRLRMIEERIRALEQSGHGTSRRVAGTGKAVTIEKVYSDTKANRDLKRVGQKYTVVRWEGATYEQVTTKLSRRKTPHTQKLGDDGKPLTRKEGTWFAALAEVKLKEGVSNKFIKIRKVLPEKEPTDDDKLGHKIYTLAIARKAELDAAAAAAAAAAVPLAAAVKV